MAVIISPGVCSIYLKSGTIDTSASSQISTQSVQPNLGSGYYLVEIKGPVTDADKQALIDTGAEIVNYIPDNAFIVHIRHSAVMDLRKLTCVKWLAPFKVEYKQSPKASRSGPAMQFLVTLFPNEKPQFILDKGKRLGARNVSCQADSRGSVCRIIANKSQIAELAKSNSVAWIEPYIQPKLCNDVASGISGVPDVRQEFGLYGASQIVGIADSGLDVGSTGAMSPDFANRIQKVYTLRRPDDWSDLNGHGTHVTGSLAGSGALSGSNPAAHNYTGSFAGYAPEAKIVFQSIGDSGEYVFPPLHLSELFQPIYQDGVRVHSDSWGSAANGEYTVYSNEVDQFVWDHKDFIVAFAVGNDGRDGDHNGIIDRGNIYAPATAKNCIAVGATENLRLSGGYQTRYGLAWPSDYPNAPINYDLISDNISGMAAFSGRGPTSDGRIKPDICAPGTNIISSRSHMPNSASGWELYNSDYIYWGGTSMSTPQVAGAAALVREYYMSEKAITPSAALIKATLINGAVDMSPGQYGTGSFRELWPAPDNSQGWGRLNLKRSLCPDPPTVNEFADESSPISTGDFRDYQYTVTDNSIPLKVTLVWTDYPGSVNAAKELVNDLDLIVISPSGATYPFLGVCDHTNNVEQVTIAKPELGAYLVRVSGYNVPMGPQDYALVVSGGLPTTYIAGSVLSSSGAPVQGASIMFVSSTGTKRLTTNSSGRFTSHVSPGTYSVQVSKQGWTFTPRAQLVQVADAPVDNVIFHGTGAPGGLSGKISSVIGGVVSQIVESPHPYLNSCDQVYPITARQGATRVRLHFAEIDLMNDGDTIYVLDGNDRRVDTFTGRGEDIWSSWVTGSVIKIEIVTNSVGNIGYGFYVDGYETDLIDQGGLGGASITLAPGNYTATTAADGSYNFMAVPPGTYTVTPSMLHWKFQPNLKSIDIPAGTSMSGVDFQGFPPGSITGEVKVSTSTIQAVSVESAHPYDNNTDQVWQIDGGETATRIRLHFSRISTEPAWDWVIIMDGSDTIIESYTDQYTDLWTPWINGSIARINLTSDVGNTDYGFKCDRYEIETQGSGVSGVLVNMEPDGRATTTAVDGSFTLSSVDVGSHTIFPTSSMWLFDPESASLSVAAGIEQHLLFYARAGTDNLSAAKALSDGSQLTLTGVNVSAVFNGYFYVQDSSRTGGIRINSSAQVHEGDRLKILGTLSTAAGERRLTASTVTQLQ